MLAALRPQFWWYLARASGMVAWVLLAASMLLGVVLAARAGVRGVAPRVLLDLHRFTGGLAVAFAGVHLLGLVVDSYLTFAWAEILVPFASAYEPGAVAWGVVAMYLLVAVEVTSLAMRRLPRRAWRAVHLASYVAFAMATVHGLFAGADARRAIFLAVAVLLGGAVVVTAADRALSTRPTGPRR